MIINRGGFREADFSSPPPRAEWGARKKFNSEKREILGNCALNPHSLPIWPPPAPPSIWSGPPHFNIGPSLEKNTRICPPPPKIFISPPPNTPPRHKTSQTQPKNQKIKKILNKQKIIKK